jgi:hypothetical protein
MATAPQVARPAPKNETYVEEQLRRARQRIRRLDTLAAVFGFILITLAYGLALVCLDRWLTLPSLARQVALGGYVLGAGVYLWFMLARPWMRPINPYFAARQLEQMVPEAKNSVVNWLDLREQKLAPAIRNAVSSRAAKDMSRTNVDEAISGRRVGRLGAAATVLVLAAVVLLLICQPTQFFSLLRRTFVPFVETGVATRTYLEVIQPVTPVATVPLNQSVPFEVQLSGREPRFGQPDAPAVHFRYSQAEPVYQERPLEPGDQPHAWLFRLPAFEVHTGFYYYLSAGDFRTPEYQVRAVSGPLLTSFDVTYTPRAYLRREKYKTTQPTLEALRGTAISILAHTNRTVRDGSLQINGVAEPVVGQRVLGQPDTLQFQFVLDKGDSYRIRFTSEEGEASGDSVPYGIKILTDLAPQVELKEPNKDVTLPANGALPLEGVASDDFGITSMTLRLQVANGPNLQPKAYRQDEKKSFKFDDGTYPRTLQYHEVLDLTKVKDEAGQVVAFKAGQVIEYWLEAADNCDYPPPGPNVGRTEKTYKINLVPAEKDPQKSQDQRKKAEEQARKEQQQQDQDHDKTNKEQHQGKGPQPENNPENSKPNDPKGSDPKGDDPKTQPNDPKNPPNQPDNPQKPPEQPADPKTKPAGGDNASQSPEQKERDDKLQKMAEKVKQQLDKHPGEAKPEEKPKPDQSSASDGPKGNEPPKENKAESKPNGSKKDGDNQPGGNKQGGSEKKESGEKKPGGTPQAQPDDAGHTKDNGGSGQAGQPGGNTGGSKEAGNAPGKPGDQKGANSGDKTGDKASATGGGKPSPEQPKNSKDPGKESVANSKPSNAPPGEGKPQPSPSAQDGTSAQGNEAGTSGSSGSGSEKMRETGRDEVKGLADQLKSKDPGQRENAAKELNDIARRGSDPQAQKDAREALKKDGRPAPSGDSHANENPPNGNDNGNGGNGKSNLEKAADELREKAGQMGKDIDKMSPKEFDEFVQKMADEIKEQAKTGKPSGDNSGKKSGPPSDEELRKMGMSREQFDKVAKGIADKMGQPSPREVQKEVENARKADPSKFGKELDKMSPEEREQMVNQIAEELRKQAKDGKPAPTEKKGAPTDEELKQSKLTREELERLSKAVADRMRQLGQDGPDGIIDHPTGRPEQRDPVDPTHRRKAGDLTLEQFKDKVTAKDLEQLKMTPEEYQRFLREYAELQKRQPKNSGGPETLPGPRLGDRGPITTPHTVNPTGKAPTDVLPGAAPAQAPPEYRNAYQEFTQGLSQVKRPADKK